MRASWMLLLLAAAPVGGWAAERHEATLSLDQVPAPVKATLEKESAGAKLGEVEKETEGGRTFYEAAVTKDGRRSYLHVADDGKVLKRESPAQEPRAEGSEHEHTR